MSGSQIITFEFIFLYQSMCKIPFRSLRTHPVHTYEVVLAWFKFLLNISGGNISRVSEDIGNYNGRSSWALPRSYRNT